jgi:putative membrane protein insertion efficiency factor
MEKILKSLQRAIGIVMISTYKTFLQVPPGLCRFYPTCSDYAIQSLEQFSGPKALWLIAKRVIKCNPLCRGGFDPLPLRGKGK